MLGRAPLAALKRSLGRSNPLSNHKSRRSYFWRGGNTQQELVGADKHKVERFTPQDPRRKKPSTAEAPPLHTLFPGVPESATALDTSAAKTRITVLDNGLRVASEENFSQMSVVGLYVNTGTRFEDSTSYGSSYMLERMSFKVRF
jgi:hypothetical protein